MWLPHHWQIYNVVRFFSELSIKIWFSCYVLAVMLMDMNKGSHFVRAYWCFYYAAATQVYNVVQCFSENFLTTLFTCNVIAVLSVTGHNAPET